MRALGVLKRVKLGEEVLVTLSKRSSKPLYSFTDGTEVSREQFLAIRGFLTPGQPALLPGAEPQSYVWAG